MNPSDAPITSQQGTPPTLSASLSSTSSLIRYVSIRGAQVMSQGHVILLWILHSCRASSQPALGYLYSQVNVFRNLCARCISPSCPCNDGIRQTYEQFFPEITQCPLLQRQMESMCKQNSSCLQAAHEGNVVLALQSNVPNAFGDEVY